MSASRKKTWIQCQECGKIFYVPYMIKMEEMYVVVNCPRCGEVTGLNLGDDEDDVYALYNINVDPRCY